MSDDNGMDVSGGGEKTAARIESVCDELELSDSVVNNATELFYQRYKHADGFRGKNLDVVASAVIYAAAKIEHIGVPVTTVSEQLSVDESRVFNELKQLENTVDIPIPVETPQMFISHIVTRLNEADECFEDDIEATETVAKELAEDITSRDYSNGMSASGVAAGAVYTIGKFAPWVESTPTQRQVARAADVAVVTVRDQYHGITNEIEIGDYFPESVLRDDHSDGD